MLRPRLYLRMKETGFLRKFFVVHRESFKETRFLGYLEIIAIRDRSLHFFQHFCHGNRA